MPGCQFPGRPGRAGGEKGARRRKGTRHFPVAKSDGEKGTRHFPFRLFSSFPGQSLPGNTGRRRKGTRHFPVRSGRKGKAKREKGKAKRDTSFPGGRRRKGTRLFPFRLFSSFPGQSLPGRSGPIHSGEPGPPLRYRVKIAGKPVAHRPPLTLRRPGAPGSGAARAAQVVQAVKSPAPVDAAFDQRPQRRFPNDEQQQ